tara:strand:+ start:204 stop:797 length:594 start_codon:yes stop_codon:yes gene_type:complete
MIDLIHNFLFQFNLIIDNNFTLSLIIYFIFSIVFFTFSLPGSLIIILSSSFFFGFFLGYLINIISVTFGSLFFFLFFKIIYKKYANKKLEKFSNKLNKIIKKSSLEYLILLRLIFGVPLFIQNLFLSTLEISKKKFILSSFLGFSPYMMIFSFIGNQFSTFIDIKTFNLGDILSLEFISIFLIIIFFLLLRIFLKFK